MPTAKLILSGLFVLAFAGCVSNEAIVAAQARAEAYERLKTAVISAPDAQSEAVALRQLGQWLASNGYGYTLSVASQPNSNGVNLDKMLPGEGVELSRHARSDYEPRPGTFSFVPKDKWNLKLLESR